MFGFDYYQQGNSLKIAQVAPLYESVPPKQYGGTERVVAYLTEELVKLGHEVTLFASGDSCTSATLIPQCAVGLRLSGSRDPLAYHVRMIERVFQRAAEFDVIHFHIDHLQYPLARRSHAAHVTTLHGRLDMPEVLEIFQEFHDMPVVAISESQRSPLRWLNWQGVIHHGAPEGLYAPGDGAGGYLAFLGRMSAEKRVDLAIRAAIEVGLPLKIAAKLDRADLEFFDSMVKPLLDHPLIEYVGEIGDAEKGAFLGGALALLFPIDWPEPFGMVLIEALACGTPVVAMRRGSVPEILDNGVTGVLVDEDGGVSELAQGVALARRLDRHTIRRVFEQRFTAERMALEYLMLYESMLAVPPQVRVARKVAAFD